MSRDDYISKLFIKNQDKLEQAPSADLWSRLEAELDAVPEATPPKEAPPTTGGSVRRLWMPYAVAASVLLLLLAGGGIYRFWDGSTSVEMLDDGPIALATEPEFVVTEPEPYLATPEEATEPTTALIIEEQEAEEVQEQEQRIVEAVKERLEQEAPSPKAVERADEIDIQDVEVADDAGEQPVEWVEPMPVAPTNVLPSKAPVFEEVKQATQQQPDYYQNDQLVQEKDLTYNYNRNVVPQLSNQVDNKEQVERVLQKAKKTDQKTMKKRENSDAASGYSSRASRGGIVAQADKGAGIESPMADAHPRLYPFGFLVGKWEDDKELEGKSYEVWHLRNRTTLQGRGYKLSSDGTQVFEETFKIVFKNSQVFLQLSFEEGQRPVEYLLTSFTQERFVFEQREYARQPNRIVLQQNGLDGYTFTMTNTNTNVFLSADQQRYLENRNRVSNVRSTRTLRAAQ